MPRGLPDPTELARQLTPLVCEVAREAGALALSYFRSGRPTAARIWSKVGGSPVTEADVAVDTLLKIKLSAALPDAGWLSEETADDARRLGRDLVWIVDPIDGTRAFLSGSHDWSVAIALMAGGSPLIGIVLAPAHGALYEAQRGAGSRRNGQPVGVSPAAALSDLAVAGPQPSVDSWEGTIPGLRRPPRIPSLALRLCRVADGSVDVGLVSPGARDWDLAAADLILAEAGGALSDHDGVAPVYNRADPVHPALIAAPARLHGLMIDSLRAPSARTGSRRQKRQEIR